MTKEYEAFARCLSTAPGPHADTLLFPNVARASSCFHMLQSHRQCDWTGLGQAGDDSQIKLQVGLALRFALQR
jgi:hypothetical protein